MPAMGTGYRFHITGLTHDSQGFPTSKPQEVETLMNRLFRKIDQHYYDIQMVEEIECDDADIAIVAYGSVARSAELAVHLAREQGVRAGLLKLKTLFPFPRQIVERVARQSRVLIVPEMNMGQMSREVKRVNNGMTRVVTLNRVDGQIITPSELLKTVLGSHSR